MVVYMPFPTSGRGAPSGAVSVPTALPAAFLPTTSHADVARRNPPPAVSRRPSLAPSESSPFCPRLAEYPSSLLALGQQLTHPEIDSCESSVSLAAPASSLLPSSGLSSGPHCSSDLSSLPSYTSPPSIVAGLTATPPGTSSIGASASVAAVAAGISVVTSQSTSDLPTSTATTTAAAAAAAAATTTTVAPASTDMRLPPPPAYRDHHLVTGPPPANVVTALTAAHYLGWSNQIEVLDAPVGPAQAALSDKAHALSSLEYSTDTLTYLLSREDTYMASADYMAHQGVVTPAMRRVLIDWLVEVAIEYKLGSEALYLAVNYIDRFLSKMHVARTIFQLVGIVSLMIAAKMVCVRQRIPPLSTFVAVCNSIYDARDLRAMELCMMETLSFELCAPTCASFNPRFLQMVEHVKVDEDVFNVTWFLTELALLSYEMVSFRKSLVSASALFISLCVTSRAPPALSSEAWAASEEGIAAHAALPPAYWHLQHLHLQQSYHQYLLQVYGQIWPNYLAEAAGFSISQLLPCVRLLHALFIEACGGIPRAQVSDLGPDPEAASAASLSNDPEPAPAGPAALDTTSEGLDNAPEDTAALTARAAGLMPVPAAVAFASEDQPIRPSSAAIAGGSQCAGDGGSPRLQPGPGRSSAAAAAAATASPMLAACRPPLSPISLPPSSEHLARANAIGVDAPGPGAAPAAGAGHAYTAPQAADQPWTVVTASPSVGPVPASGPAPRPETPGADDGGDASPRAPAPAGQSASPPAPLPPAPLLSQSAIVQKFKPCIDRRVSLRPLYLAELPWFDWVMPDPSPQHGHAPQPMPQSQPQSQHSQPQPQSPAQQPASAPRPPMRLRPIPSPVPHSQAFHQEAAGNLLNGGQRPKRSATMAAFIPEEGTIPPRHALTVAAAAAVAVAAVTDDLHKRRRLDRPHSAQPTQ
ncbi:hypothetical protein H696_03480 [Fonticula alba]|uniref:Uncharacterized protein n=1 Tax=Fonticula alba TaxID=691883 RepID=A0A058Z7Z4_FONAL|nr:hypothetical protein H696_03480 [Fonticula alba]KCV70013.1 hypothetical protein H696_03480 [Fonticula alba]|eukprot:XP_009495619.1 hypothetical protein H696_03480 [Fonticula alba]